MLHALDPRAAAGLCATKLRVFAMWRETGNHRWANTLKTLKVEARGRVGCRRAPLTGTPVGSLASRPLGLCLAGWTLVTGIELNLLLDVLTL